VLTESDSGGSGISAGPFGTGFALDSRRDHVATSPKIDVRLAHDIYRQFPGMLLFVFPSGPSGVFDVTATGEGMAPFTFHLVVGILLPYPAYSSVAVKVGDIVAQQWDVGCGEAPPPPLTAPVFELVQDESAVSTTVVPATLQFTFNRRAYRVLQLTGWPVPSATPYVFGPCLPVGFPRYPLMTFPGSKSPTCTWDIPSNDSETHVFAFYETQLNQGDWRITSQEGSTITFREQMNYAFGGTVTVDSSGNVHVTAGFSDSSNGPYTICRTPGS
jgi:hypothetical protein